MRIFDAISFNSFFLMLAGVSIFIFLVFLFSERKKTYRAAMMLDKAELEVKKKKEGEEQEIKTSIIDKMFGSTKLLSKYSPYNIIMEARSIEWNIGYKEYLTIFLGGGVGVSFLLWTAIGRSPLALYGMLAGFVIPRIAIYYQTKKYEERRRDRIAIFMKAMSNSMAVFNSAIDSVNEVMPLVHETIRADLVKAQALLKSGKSLSYAFKDMVESYPYPDFTFFIDMLEVAHEHGGEYNDILTNIAEDFDQTKLLQVKLRRVMSMAKRAFYQNAGFVALLPVIFMFIQGGQLYAMIVSGPLGLVGRLILVGNLVVIAYFWYKLEKISKFDIG
ncbi:type II secretion system F family protein [Virgibacillus halodenitrificans]|uniref:type II secretion system F family protein n=1 Tax=Virgibacillus halodenitrificans TaxID=1482 RepID=UPI000EF539EE|nr:type II secretion system F family protein [Virgibacillus halodenitrificans]